MKLILLTALVFGVVAARPNGSQEVAPSRPKINEVLSGSSRAKPKQKSSPSAAAIGKGTVLNSKSRLFPQAPQGSSRASKIPLPAGGRVEKSKPRK